MTVFDVRNIISFDFFYSFILNESIFFNTHKCELLKKYDVLKPVAWDWNVDKYQDFRTEYRALVRRVVAQTIKQYRVFLPEKCLIVEFGDFIKHTERILSNVDFKIYYDELQSDEYKCVQELIDYSVARILGRVNLHERRLDSTCLIRHCRLLFDGFKIDYEKNSQENTYDYKAVTTTCEKKYKSNTNKMFAFSVLENTTEYDFVADMAKIETKIFGRANFNFDKTTQENIFLILDLMHIFENDCIDKLCSFVTSVNNLVFARESHLVNIEMLWEDVSVLDLFGDEFLNDLKMQFVTFIFYWNRIELSFHSRGISSGLSSHIRFTIDEINRILYCDWGESTNMQTILSVKKRLTELITEGMTKLSEIKVENRIKSKNREIERVELTR